MIIIIFIIIICILYINKKELFKNFNYQGPIIFLQKGDIEKKNCLGKMDYHQCIGDHGRFPNKKYYPNDEELEYLNYPNIIKIPQGKKGIKGFEGSLGLNQGSTYRPTNNNITRITSNKYEDKLKIISNDNEININNNEGNIKLQSHSEICIQNNCIQRKDIEDIIKIFK